jgi:hypothetical protein
VTVRSALLDALAKQNEEIANIQTELRRERKETAKRKLGRLTPRQFYYMYDAIVSFANWFVIIDKERRETLEFFGTVDPTKSHHTAIGLRQPGTGIWFTDGQDFKQWVENRNARLWLYGIRKSSVLISLCRERDMTDSFWILKLEQERLF